MKRLRGVPLVLVTLAMVGCGDTGDDTTIIKTTAPPTTTDPLRPDLVAYDTDAYSIRIPAGWTLEDDNVDEGGYHQSKWTSPTDPETFVLVNVNDEPVTASAAESAETVRADLTGGSSYEELGFASATVAGNDGIRWEFQNEGDQRVDYFFNDCEPAQGFAVLGSAPPGDFEELSATFQQVAESVQAKCAVSPPPTTTDSECEPSYPDVCLPPFSGDPSAIDCEDVPAENITVLPPDPYHLDGSPPEASGSPDAEAPDGVGCETYP